MKIIVTGSSGMIASALINHFSKRGCEVVGLSHRNHKQSKNGVKIAFWNPEKKILDKNILEKVDSVIHLAGESIQGRWTESKKRRILESRINSTLFLCEAFNRLKIYPKVFLVASGIHYYGVNQDNVFTENAEPGASFLAEVCQKWELASKALDSNQTRIIQLRFGVVLGRAGGVLKPLIPLFKWGLGSKLGSGKQWMSWISLRDAVAVVDFCIHQPSLIGPINVVSPAYCTHEMFIDTLSKCLNRYTLLSIPESIIRCFLGEMGSETALASIKARPEKLENAGFTFQDRDIDQALCHLFKKVRD